MSGPPPTGGAPSAPRPTANGVGSSMMAPQHAQGGPPIGGPPPNTSQSNLNNIVMEYLAKKGYSKTEAMLRAESANQEVESGPVLSKTDDSGPASYMKAFDAFKSWMEDNLDVYKPDLRRLLWPVFVYAYLKLVSDNYGIECRAFFDRYRDLFENEHTDDIRALQAVTLAEHTETNSIAKIYLNNKYRVSLSIAAFHTLVRFLESKLKTGGDLIMSILQIHLQVVTVDRLLEDQSAFAQRLSRAKAPDNFPAEDEGIPGHNPGSGNTQRETGSNVLTRVRLGPMPKDKDLMEDVRGDLEEEDTRNPPKAGQDSLLQHFDQRIKREESEDCPSRNDIVLPPSTARDVAMEVQKVKEDRDRFKIESRVGGVGPTVSVVMYTFHNTQDSINVLDFSDDNFYVAAGMTESHIRLWRLDGKAIISVLDRADRQPSAYRRLIGHSGPVYGVSFSPCVASDKPDSTGPSTGPKYLLSCSADKTIRMWSMETLTCLVVYKGHDLPVWDIKWGPFGLYFLSGSMDKTARLWRTDHIAYLRMFAGHERDVDVVEFHPNGVYVFTASCDRTVRMWAVSNGYCVRMFTGHTGNLTSMACSPNGKLLASADDSGTIILWDLASGRLKKRMKGHARGGIWSLTWSVESTVIVSAGADCTVRVWDVDPPAEPNSNTQGKVIAEGGGGTKIDANAQAPAGVGVGSKKKGKDVQVTADQISAFPTKKSPVYKVRFTRQNLVLAGGAYLP